MATQNHEYHVRVIWQGGRDGSGEATTGGTGQALPLRVPFEFQGPGGGTNPEEILTAAVASCYAITLGIVTTNRKLPVTEITAEVTGIVEQQGVSLAFRSMVVRPRIGVTREATDEQIAAVEEMAHKADGYCIVTNAIRGKVEVTVEPEVVRQG